MVEALEKAYDTGFIEDINDPWESLPCFGNYDPETNTLFNCDQCPMSTLCANEFEEISNYH